MTIDTFPDPSCYPPHDPAYDRSSAGSHVPVDDVRLEDVQFDGVFAEDVDPAWGGEPPGVLAWRAADAVRALNHATLAVTGRGAGYRYPSEVDTVVGALHTLADRLPQALTQIGRWLQNQHRQGRIGHDQHTVTTDDEHTDPGPAEPGEVVEAAVRALLADLDDAAHAATALAGELRRARSITTHLTGTGR